MKKVKKATVDDDTMRPQYDFSAGVRGKYYERFRQSSNVVVLDPDVSDTFPNSEAVNDALRALAKVARRSARIEKRAPSPSKRPNKRMQQTRAASPRKKGPRS
jgi:hypothetical protein